MLVEQVAADRRWPRAGVGGRVDADDGVAAAEQQAVERGRGDAARVVGRVVGLQAGGQPAGQPDGGAERGDDGAAARHRDQVLVAHELADGGDHLRGEAGSDRGGASRGDQRVRTGGDVEQPVAEPADGQVRDAANAARSWVSTMSRVTSSSS